MNERIRELQKQSSIKQWDPDTGCYRYILNPEKFAELIVRECRDMFVVNSVSWNLLNEKLEHFGVEE